MNAIIDISSVRLHTNRLVLRPFTQNDLYDLFEYASVDGVGQMAGWSPHKSIAESKMILDMFILGKKTFAIEYDNKVIGSIGIEKYNEKVLPEFQDKKGRELGFVLSKDFWGMGLMPEALKEVIRFLFEETGLDFIICGHFAGNIQSLRVQEKCGFTHYIFFKDETIFGTGKDYWFSLLEKYYYFFLKTY